MNSTVLICLGVIYAALLMTLVLAALDCIGLKHYGVNRMQPVLLPNQWFTFGVMHYPRDFDRKEPGEEYFICIHLPVYGLRYHVNTDTERWSQDCVYIGFARGWRMFSIEVPAVGPQL